MFQLSGPVGGGSLDRGVSRDSHLPAFCLGISEDFTELSNGLGLRISVKWSQSKVSLSLVVSEHSVN